MAGTVGGSGSGDDGHGRGIGDGSGGALLRRALVVTVSDGVAAGVRQDVSGEGLAARLAELGFEVDRAVVPDEQPAIEALLRTAAVTHVLVVTTGGTGLTPRDVTPQAARAAVAYEIPGLGELMRAEGAKSTPYSYLSRSLAGVLGRCLVLCVPGSPRGALESLAALEPVLSHALDTVTGPFDHDAGSHPARG